jgi:hypothetical protein
MPTIMKQSGDLLPLHKQGARISGKYLISQSGCYITNFLLVCYATDMDFLDWLHTQLKELETFSAAMVASSAFQQEIVINVVSQLLPPGKFSASNDEVLLVDVGGGRGRFLNEVRKARPDL